jgi:hypothetical protein
MDAPSTPPLSKLDALRAYAKMMHHLSADYLAPLLADDFHYASQWVFEEITSKQQYLDYIRPKLEAIKTSGNRVWAELAELQSYPGGPCLVMAQGDRTNISATVLVEVVGSKVKRLDMCFVPSPHSARRSGEYPE